MRVIVRSVAIAVAVVLSAAAAGPAQAVWPPKVPAPAVAVQLTDTAPGASTGITVQLKFPPSATGRPYSVNSIGVRFPEGMKVDQRAVPRCRASDAELYLRGPGVCARSKLGVATAAVDFVGPGSRVLGAPYEEFLLGDGEIIIFEYNQLGRPGPDGATLFPLIFRAPLSDRGFTMFIPEGPSGALPDLLWALETVDLTFSDTGVFRLPTQATGEAWEFTFDFGYYIGAQTSRRVQVDIAK